MCNREAQELAYRRIVGGPFGRRRRKGRGLCAYLAAILQHDSSGDRLMRGRSHARLKDRGLWLTKAGWAQGDAGSASAGVAAIKCCASSS
jgi:hypothetical protein